MKYANEPKRLPFPKNFLLLTLICALTAAAGSAWAADSYQVNNGANVNITEHTVCRKVTNNHASGLPIFVPTKTAPEWSSFYTSPPAGVTATGCITPGSTDITVSGNFVIPAYNNITVTVWGGGGGGGGGGISSNSIAGTGLPSVFSGLTATGGTGGWGNNGGGAHGNGGTWAGGTSGANGSNGTDGGNCCAASGSGGAGGAPGGGAGGVGFDGAGDGDPGTAPGGGGGGGNIIINGNGGGGGGGGGMTTKTWAAGAAGAPIVGLTYGVTVGTGGAGGAGYWTGGAGARGLVRVTWN